MSRPYPIALFLAATLLAGCSGNRLLTLKFNFKPGDKFSYTMATDTKMEAPGNRINQSSTIGYTYAVQAGPGTDRDLRATYDRVTMQMDMANKKMGFDSQKPDSAAGPLAAVSRLVGKSFTVTLSDQGQVTAVKGLVEMKKDLVDPSNPDAGAVDKQMEGMLNEESIKGAMSQAFNIYPDQPVKPGSTWTRDATVNMGGMKMTTKTTYTLSSVSQGIAHLTADSKIDASGIAPMSGTQSGTMDMDVASGMLLDSKLKQNLTVQASDQAMTLVSDIHITGKKL